MTIQTENRGLLPFDKLNLALCAKQRADQNASSSDRFSSEFGTATLWMRHSLHTMGGRNWTW